MFTEKQPGAKRVALVGCAAQKSKKPAPAKDFSASSSGAAARRQAPGSGGVRTPLLAGMTTDLRMRRMVDSTDSVGEALGQPARGHPPVHRASLDRAPRLWEGQSARGVGCGDRCPADTARDVACWSAAG